MKIIIIIATFLLTQSVWALELEQAELDKIVAANYEVVVAKPTKKTVEYEREPPLHLLPFQFRNDKFYSVGSAFRIAGNKFVSAAHVLQLGKASQNKDINLRDTNGNVYPIDKIYKYSKDKDFVVFTVKGIKPGHGLKINTKYKKNKKVYAVGNALGQGVVIRDGLYTSNTPEASEGKWKWMRFSAAASPGNSGGPLLDSKGNVIGVILRKSKSENLNYALPMSEILKFGQVAELHSKTMIYKIDISNDTHTFSYDKRFDLPMDIEKIDTLLQKEMHKIFEKAASDFLVKHEEHSFPNDEGSLPVLYNRFNTPFPSILLKGSDSIWDVYKPKNLKSADTGNSGRIKYGKMRSFYYIKVTRPDNVDVKDYYSDSKIVMDQVLKGISFNRNIGRESTKVTSMGQSIQNRIHTDNFGRKWQVGNWLVGFGDQKFVAYSLPTPDGYVMMLSISSTGNADMMEIDMKIIVNNLYYTYYGTLDDWSSFLALKDITPSFIDGVSIKTDKESFINYKDKNFNFRVNNSTMKINKDSDIQLRCSYYKEGGEVVWAPVMVVFGENKDISNYASVSRNFKPPQSLDERYSSRWKSIISKRTPYDSKPYNDNQMTNITMLRANNLKTLKDNNIIYAISWHEEGEIDNAVMKSKLNELNTNFKFQN